MDALGLEDFQNSLTPHHETFADGGSVQMYVHDMHKVWERLKDTVRIEVRPEEANIIQEYMFPVPPSILWEYLTKPEYRAIHSQGNQIVLMHIQTNITSCTGFFQCSIFIHRGILLFATLAFPASQGRARFVFWDRWITHRCELGHFSALLS
jgi:hypothetical protein